MIKRIVVLFTLCALFVVGNLSPAIAADVGNNIPLQTSSEYDDVGLLTVGPIPFFIAKIELIDSNSSQIHEIERYLTKVNFRKPNAYPQIINVEDLNLKVSYRRDIILRRAQYGQITFLDGSLTRWPRLEYWTLINDLGAPRLNNEKHELIIEGFNGKFIFCNFHLPVIYQFQIDGNAEHLTVVEYT